MIASAASNRMVQALTDWIFEVVQPSLIELLEPAIVHAAIHEQHAALLAAMEKGDSARAERAMKDHLLYLRDVLRMVQPARRPGRAHRVSAPVVIAVLGLGEAVSAIAADLVAAGVTVRAFDPVRAPPPACSRPRDEADAVRGAEIVLSLNSAAVAGRWPTRGAPGSTRRRLRRPQHGRAGASSARPRRRSAPTAPRSPTWR